MSSTYQLLRRELESHSPYRVEDSNVARAAVALILAPDDAGSVESLLLKRVTRAQDPWSGQIALPGGKIEPRDDDLLDTAIRETYEETGIELQKQHLLGVLGDVYPRTPVLPDLFVRPYVFWLPRRPHVQLNYESELWLWVSQRHLQSARELRPIRVRETVRTVWGYPVGEHFVWGMTERVLAPFQDLARSAGILF